MNETLVGMHADQGTVADVFRIQQILHSRPADNADSWQPPDRGWFIVAKDEEGLWAFAVASVEGENIIVYQIEGEYAADAPTRKGKEGLAVLESFFHHYRDEHKLGIMGVIALENKPHLEALFHRGYRPKAVVMYLPPPSASKTVKEIA